jgi:hypothetical protein
MGATALAMICVLPSNGPMLACDKYGVAHGSCGPIMCATLTLPLGSKWTLNIVALPAAPEHLVPACPASTFRRCIAFSLSNSGSRGAAMARTGLAGA